MDKPSNQKNKVFVKKEVNPILKTTQEIAEKIAQHPDCNTYMPLSAGIESTAALLYAVKDPEMKPFCVHWYEQRYGLFADAMAFYTQKQAEYFNLPYGNDKSMLSMLPYTQEVPIIVSGLSSFMSMCIAQPGGIKFKWFMMGANAEDDMRMRLQFREYRKIMATYVSDSLDGTGVDLAKTIDGIPQVINPLDFLTKAETYASIIREAPELLDTIWSCIAPKGTLKDKDGKITGYVPCGECFKCAELLHAKKQAADAVFRYQEGVKYFTTILKDMEGS